MNQLDDADVLADHLRRWLADCPTGPRTLTWIRRLPGHAGITYAFGAASPDGEEEGMVLKLPPAGVALRGSTDVLRQGRVLRSVHGLGLRAPAVRAMGTEDEGPFPVPFLITELVPGSPLGDVFEDVDPPAGADVAGCFDEAVDELVRIHSVAWSDEVVQVLGRRRLDEEIRHWAPLLGKALDPTWTTDGLELQERLVATAPSETRIGLVHGDYYSNNWLFDDGRLTGVVDWENTVWGPQLVDVGWLCMIYDPPSWGPLRQPTLSWTPDPDAIAARYADRGGAALEQLSWFRALAGYRLACLTAHYLRLHVLGRRHDPVWEVFGDGFRPMLARAHQLLDDRRR